MLFEFIKIVCKEYKKREELVSFYYNEDIDSLQLIVSKNGLTYYCNLSIFLINYCRDYDNLRQFALQTIKHIEEEFRKRQFTHMEKNNG